MAVCAKLCTESIIQKECTVVTGNHYCMISGAFRLFYLRLLDGGSYKVVDGRADMGGKQIGKISAEAAGTSSDNT